jgi:hypothetical protein
MDFSIIQKADLSASELALLIRYKDANGETRSMTRAAVYRWVSGKALPNAKVRIRVDKVLALINTAVEQGDLPLKLGTPRTERKRLIAGAVGKHLHIISS